VVGEGSARICQCTVGLASRRRLESHACRAQRCGWPGSSLEALHSATVLGSDPVAARLILERSTISRNLALMQNKGRVADARFICRVSGSRQPVTAGRASLVLHRSHCRPGPGTKCVSGRRGNTRT